MKFGRRIAFDLNEAQAEHFRQAAGVSRLAWNWALGRWNEQYAAAKAEPDAETRKGMWPSAAKLKAEWAEVRRRDFPFTLDVTKCAGTQAILDLGATFTRAFKERRDATMQKRKPRKMFGFPRFKAKGKATPAFALWNDQMSVCNHFSVLSKPYATLRVPNLGPVRLRETVPGVGGILGARISYRRGRWFVAFQFDTEWVDGERSDQAALAARVKALKAGGEVPEVRTRPERLLPLHPAEGTIGGFDLGLIDAVVGQVRRNGKAVATIKVPNPRRLARSERERRIRLRRERKLARSIHRARLRAAAADKGARGDATPVRGRDLKHVRLRLSNRQRRQAGRLSVQRWTEADRRADFLHKTALAVAVSSEIVVLEDLHVAGMLRNPALARSMGDAALGRLGGFVDYKAERAGGLCLRAPRFFPSTRRCSACGKVRAALDLGVREWACEACAAVHDRDGNAGANLAWLGESAASEGPPPEDAAPWAAWLSDARERVAIWRAATSVDRTFRTHEIVGAACPEVTRGERADRGRRKPSRGACAEPRTTRDRVPPSQADLFT